MNRLLHFAALVATVAVAVKAASNSSYLQATALVTNAQNHSALQCWQFTDPATVSSEAGTSGSATFAFANTTETIYTVIPARFNGGTHNAPVPQIVTFLSGLAHITLPVAVHGNSTLDEAWIVGGADGFLIAVDTGGTGHITTYPTDQPTVSLQIPFASMEDVPAYSVVSEGPCHSGTSGGQLV
ncbi:hypothetical protein LTR85_004774 [Meristemomyces frigidus]|nr:hypothetical protein LTR85_004774 [Meristemomyces frigidus]